MTPAGRFGVTAVLGFAFLAGAAVAVAEAGAASRLGPPVLYPYPGDAVMVDGSLGDVNSDGRLDAVAAASFLDDGSTFEPSGVVVALGRGDGTFGTLRGFRSTEDIQGPRAGGLYEAALADLDGDGHTDAVSLGSEGTTVQRGLGDGSFDAGRTGDGGGRALAALSADGDARGDLAIAAGYPGPAGQEEAQRAVVGVFLGADDAPFGRHTAYGTAGPGEVGRAIAAADMNADRLTDIVVASSAGSGDGTERPPLRVFVLLGRGDGTFVSTGAAVGPPRSPAAPDPDIAIGDADGNGRLDVVVVDRGAVEGEVTLYRGDGAGAIGPAEELRQLDTPGASQLAVGDVSGDGIADLVGQQSPHCASGPAGGGCKTAFLFAEGRGGGGFAPWVANPELGAPRGMELADLNRDRLLDVLTYRSDGFTVRLGGGLVPAGHDGMYTGPSKTTSKRLGDALISVTAPRRCVPAGDRMRVLVKVRKRRARSGRLRVRRVRHVAFIRNGTRVALDRRAPYSAIVRTDGLLEGARHELLIRVTAYLTGRGAPRRGTVRRDVRRTFTIC